MNTSIRRGGSMSSSYGGAAMATRNVGFFADAARCGAISSFASPRPLSPLLKIAGTPSREFVGTDSSSKNRMKRWVADILRRLRASQQLQPKR